jgi:protein-S-isoprenylcysteine O-methyltransferase Ste14
VNSLELKVPPPVVTLLVALGMWAMARLLPGLLVPAWPNSAAAVVALVGAGIGVSGFIGFRRHGTTIDPLKPDKASALVTGGVYRYTRNPMYLGLTIGLLAWALRLGSVVAFLGPALFVPFITRFQIFPEERALRGLFGPAYTEYAARVRRWV